MKTMKISSCFFLIIFLFSCLSSCCCKRHKVLEFGHIDWSKNIINIVFDIENFYFGDLLYFDTDQGIVRKADLEKSIKSLLDEARTKIPIFKNYSREEIKAVSLAINNFLKDKGHEYQEVEKYSILEHNLISAGTIRKKENCFGYMINYLMIGENSGYTYSGIYVAGHFAIKWNKNINWDPMAVQLCNDDAYAKWANLTPRSRSNGFYLEILTKKQIAGAALANIARTLREQKRYKEMDHAMQGALCLFPSPETLNEMGMGLKARKRYKEAVKYFYQAIDLDENFSQAYSNLIEVFVCMGEFEAAKNKMIKLSLINKILAEELKIYLKIKYNFEYKIQGSRN